MSKKENLLVTQIAEAPARALEEAVVSSEEALARFNRPLRDAESYWSAVGPGLTTGAAGDDPSGIATYSQAGARFGFDLIWLAPFSLPLMTAITDMCSRIGMATGRGLAGNIRILYKPWVIYFLSAIIFLTNSFNIGANLGAMANATRLILPGFSAVTLLLVFSIVSLGLQVFVTYSRYAKFLKYLSMILLLYIATALTLDNIPWRDIWSHAFWPSFTFGKETFVMITALLGTTISPYMFFWQTSQEVEERRMLGKFRIKLRHQVLRKKEVRRMRFDVVVGMFFSSMVMFFIILTAGAVLYPAGIQIETAEQAALALKPLAGNQAFILFALGIIGTGLLSIPILAGSAAYSLAETFRWSAGFNRGLKHAHAFYGVIIIAMGIGLIMNFLGLNTIKMLIWSAVLNGLVAPIILYFIVKISGNGEVMGNWKNGPVLRWLGKVTVAIMVLAALGALAALI
ncbi:MAG: divalent metal cation transporter [Candidatus Doudnabacteria bacterium]